VETRIRFFGIFYTFLLSLSNCFDPFAIVPKQSFSTI
jgi:hypothetical protein